MAEAQRITEENSAKKEEDKLNANRTISTRQERDEGRKEKREHPH